MSYITDNSSGNFTLDELVKSLLIHPLAGIIDDQVQVIWDIDEPSILESFLSEETEQDLNAESTNTLKEEIAKLFKRQSVRRDDIADLIKKESLKRANEMEAKRILMMTPEEILERIKCKCKELKAKYKKKESEAAISETAKSSSDSRESLLKTSSKLSRMSKRSKMRTNVSDVELKINCKEFLSIKDYAIYFIDDLLIEAEKKVNEQYDVSHSEYSEVPSECVEITQIDSQVSSVEELSTNYSSLKIDEFTPQYGHDFVMDTILTWNLEKPWTYCIDFISENSDTCTDFYNYEVKWSLPTMSYPIPQVTASVFFTIEVSRVRSSICPVKVIYNFETERYKFNLEDDIQHEVFLDSIIQNKMEFFKNLRF